MKNKQKIIQLVKEKSTVVWVALIKQVINTLDEDNLYLNKGFEIYIYK